MFNPLCIIFLTSAGFLSVQSLKRCPLGLSVDISDGTLLSNLSICHNDVVFPKETQFLFENKIRACVCDIKTCVRKCCPEGQYFTKNGCDWYSKCKCEIPPLLQFHRYAEPVSRIPDVYKIYDKSCSGPDKELVLLQEDKFYLQVDGQLYVPGLKDRMIPQDEFCYDYFDFGTTLPKFSVALCVQEDSKKAEASYDLFPSIGSINVVNQKTIINPAGPQYSEQPPQQAPLAYPPQYPPQAVIPYPAQYPPQAVIPYPAQYPPPALLPYPIQPLPRSPCKVAGISIIGTVCKEQCEIAPGLGNCPSSQKCCLAA